MDLYGNPVSDFSPVASVPVVYRKVDKDADDDKMLDDWELEHFGTLTRNGQGDRDEDGLTDLGEYQYKTDPNKSDTDVDGMPDGWEVDSKLNPLVDDALDDPDGDNLSNWREYVDGTDPRVWTLLITLLDPDEEEKVASRTPQFVWATSSSVSFRLEFSNQEDFQGRIVTLPWRSGTWTQETSLTLKRWEWLLLKLYLRNPDKRLYWRVRAKDDDGHEAYSEVRIFFYVSRFF